METLGDPEQRPGPSKAHSAQVERSPGDPLQPFYQEALYGHGDEEELEEDVARPSSIYRLPDSSVSNTPIYLTRREYACNEMNQRKGSSLNEDIIEKVWTGGRLTWQS